MYKVTQSGIQVRVEEWGSGGVQKRASEELEERGSGGKEERGSRGDRMNL